MSALVKDYSDGEVQIEFNTDKLRIKTSLANKNQYLPAYLHGIPSQYGSESPKSGKWWNKIQDGEEVTPPPRKGGTSSLSVDTRSNLTSPLLPSVHRHRSGSVNYVSNKAQSRKSQIATSPLRGRNWGKKSTNPTMDVPFKVQASFNGKVPVLQSNCHSPLAAERSLPNFFDSENDDFASDTSPLARCNSSNTLSPFLRMWTLDEDSPQSSPSTPTRVESQRSEGVFDSFNQQQYIPRPPTDQRSGPPTSSPQTGSPSSSPRKSKMIRQSGQNHDRLADNAAFPKSRLAQESKDEGTAGGGAKLESAEELFSQRGSLPDHQNKVFRSKPNKDAFFYSAGFQPRPPESHRESLRRFSIEDTSAAAVMSSPLRQRGNKWAHKIDKVKGTFRTLQGIQGLQAEAKERGRLREEFDRLVAISNNAWQSVTMLVLEMELLPGSTTEFADRILRLRDSVPDLNNITFEIFLTLWFPNALKDTESGELSVSNKKSPRKDELLRDLDQLWDLWDLNGNGILDRFEFKQAMSSIGVHSQDDFELIYKKITDTSGQNCITKADFRDWWINGDFRRVTL